MRRRCNGVVALIMVGIVCSCAYVPSGPSPSRVALSVLGFIFESDDFIARSGVVTPMHGERADAWWVELMRDLTDAGLSGASASNIYRPITICLHWPIDDQGLILFSDKQSRVGGYYDPRAGKIHVAGDYPYAMWSNRPSSQGLKHEMLHHWCYRTMGHMCTTGTNPMTNHIWRTPNGVNVWDYTWR